MREGAWRRVGKRKKKYGLQYKWQNDVDNYKDKQREFRVAK